MQVIALAHFEHGLPTTARLDFEVKSFVEVQLFARVYPDQPRGRRT